MHGNCIAEGTVLRARSFSRVKTYYLGSGDNDACACFLLEGITFEDLLCFPGVVFGGSLCVDAERS